MPSGKRDNTPKKLTGTLRTFCRTISLESPQYLAYTDTKYGYEATHCYDNVRHYVQNHGGDALYGWIIWENTRFKLEAEHHAVWKSPWGEIFDITPRVDREATVLFLSDPARPYDFKHTFLNRHNSDLVQRFHKNGIITREEKIPYTGIHPYHVWISKLPGNPENQLVEQIAEVKSAKDNE